MVTASKLFDLKSERFSAEATLNSTLPEEGSQGSKDHRQKDPDPTSWFQGTGDFKSHGLQDPFVCVVFWATTYHRASTKADDTPLQLHMHSLLRGKSFHLIP